MLSEYWENEGQNWAKSKLDFLLYELLHEQICGFFLLKFILPRPKQNNNLFLIVFVQNVISKFVKVLPQSLNNSLLEKSRVHFCVAAC